MARTRTDYTGERFGRLVILGDGAPRFDETNGKRHARRYLRCRCSCGREIEVKLGSLRDGRTQSCGCLNAEKFAARTANQVLDQDLTGCIFGRLTVVDRERGYAATTRQSYWRCRCECGNETVVQRSALKHGKTQSCGCLHKERATKANTTHGRYGSPEYNIWNSMRDRCRNPKNPGYRDYGGRGIQVCDRWADSFEAFLADVGSRPSPELSIDRINNDGHYEPGNVRWATREVQNLNRRTVNGMSEVGVLRDELAQAARRIAELERELAEAKKQT